MVKCLVAEFIAVCLTCAWWEKFFLSFWSCTVHSWKYLLLILFSFVLVLCIFPVINFVKYAGGYCLLSGCNVLDFRQPRVWAVSMSADSMVYGSTTMGCCIIAFIGFWDLSVFRSFRGLHGPLVLYRKR